MQDKKKKIGINPIQQYTATDPKTGFKAKSITRGGAIFKLEGMTGKKVTNPFIKKS